MGRVNVALCCSLTWSLFTSLLTHRLVLLCGEAHCFIIWDVPGDVLAAPESALCGWIGVILLSLSLIVLLDAKVTGLDGNGTEVGGQYSQPSLASLAGLHGRCVVRGSSTLVVCVYCIHSSLLASFLCMHSRIWQRTSWQHKNQPCVAGRL